MLVGADKGEGVTEPRSWEGPCEQKRYEGTGAPGSPWVLQRAATDVSSRSPPH